MGSLFKTPKMDTTNQRKLEEQHLRQQRKLDREEAARQAAARRNRAGRGSLISGNNDAGLRGTLGGS